MRRRAEVREGRSDVCVVEHVQKLGALCIEHGLSECRIYDSPEWDGNDEWRMSSEEMVVTPSSFWFVAYPKNATYHVETRAVEISDLLEKLRNGEDRVLFGNDTDELLKYLEDEEITV